MFRKDARNETNIPKSIAFLFVCSNRLTTTSKYLGINLKQCVQDKEIANYPTEIQAKSINSQFTEKERWSINIKTCSISLVIRDMEIETILISKVKNGSLDAQ